MTLLQCTYKCLGINLQSVLAFFGVSENTVAIGFVSEKMCPVTTAMTLLQCKYKYLSINSAFWRISVKGRGQWVCVEVM